MFIPDIYKPKSPIAQSLPSVCGEFGATKFNLTLCIARIGWILFIPVFINACLCQHQWSQISSLKTSHWNVTGKKTGAWSSFSSMLAIVLPSDRLTFNELSNQARILWRFQTWQNFKKITINCINTADQSLFFKIQISMFIQLWPN